MLECLTHTVAVNVSPLEQFLNHVRCDPYVTNRNIISSWFGFDNLELVADELYIMGVNLLSDADQLDVKIPLEVGDTARGRGLPYKVITLDNPKEAAWAAMQRTAPPPSITYATGTRVVKGEVITTSISTFILLFSTVTSWTPFISWVEMKGFPAIPQDVMYVHPLSISSQPSSFLFMICDGHSGVDAANFVSTHFIRLLNSKLPNKLPNFSQFKGNQTAPDVRSLLLV